MFWLHYLFWFHRTILLALKLILAGEVGPQKLPVPPSASMQLLALTPPVPQPVVVRTKPTAAEVSSSIKAHAEEAAGSLPNTSAATSLPQVPSFTGTDMFSSAMVALIQRRQARRALQAQRNSRVSGW